MDIRHLKFHYREILIPDHIGSEGYLDYNQEDCAVSVQMTLSYAPLPPGR